MELLSLAVTWFPWVRVDHCFLSLLYEDQFDTSAFISAFLALLAVFSWVLTKLMLCDVLYPLPNDGHSLQQFTIPTNHADGSTKAGAIFSSVSGYNPAQTQVFPELVHALSKDWCWLLLNRS